MKPRAALANPPSGSTQTTPRGTASSARVEPRTPYRIPCRVRLVDSTTGEVRTVVGETVNLSRRGMALHIAIDVPLGTWVETLVAHPNGDPMFLCGTVVHSRRTMASNFEIGVETNRPTTFV
jgi:hypothetical protein